MVLRIQEVMVRLQSHNYIPHRQRGYFNTDISLKGILRRKVVRAFSTQVG